MDFIKKYLDYVVYILAAIAMALVWLHGHRTASVKAERDIAQLHLSHQEAMSAALIERAEIVEGQQEINTYVSQDHEQRLAGVRAYYERRLRAQQATADLVRNLPSVPGDAREPADTGSQCVPVEEHLGLEGRAAEDALKIESIHRWYGEQRKAWKN